MLVPPINPGAAQSEQASQPISANTENLSINHPEQGEIVVEDATKALRARSEQQMEEILGLYRRLHIELDDAGRSKLIIELFNDGREPVRLLGFELADRDLSSNTKLEPGVDDAVKVMLKDANPAIRAKAARLLARLVPPDAMIVLTQALRQETDPVAAEPMLMGIARWPNADAKASVMRWFLREDAPLAAACVAVWAYAQADLLDEPTDRQAIIDRLGGVEPANLREAGMKLIARYGEASDLRELVGLMLSKDPNAPQWAANALAETPRAVEVLAQAAEEKPAFFGAAADALIRHRATPEGLRRLAQLPAPDELTRRDAIRRMGAAISAERLTEAVRLADLKPELSIMLLNRLLNGAAPISSRTAKGVIMLAELEQNASRPNRALEAAIALDGAEIDASERAKANTIKATALILLGRFDEAYAVTDSFPIWRDAIDRVTDQDLRIRAAQFVLDHSGKTLNDEQAAALHIYMQPAKSPPQG